MFASLDSFLASQNAQIAGVIIAGMCVATMVGVLLVLICNLFDRTKENEQHISTCGHWLSDMESRVEMTEDGNKSLSDRLSVLEADLSKRQAKAAEFKARIEKVGKRKA